MKRLLSAVAALSAVAIMSLATAPAGAQTAADKISGRLDFSPWGVQAAMHLARNRGWFREANLDVDI
ncbi:hypothetical protein ABTF55_20580, partial [Acinetobacter baumannii]